MEKPLKNVVVHALITPAQREAMGEILDRLVGTPIERTGDIAVEVGGKRYLFSDQSGGSTAASVERNGGIEVVRSQPPYRTELVTKIANEGLAAVDRKKHGEEFTLKSISSGWDGLTATEQRNAGKRFREQIEPDFPGQFDSWTTTDNERHYRRR